ncbi:hypothetical protein HPL003_17715 [Paenibacillus terrae HPL-003]|uniref:Uncharacterized protein n=1 Tax=Paenibacillus terrae (strain HPL-003) TaxID=985665 RepID=G7W0W0_PAETH|nr:hypothetical protein [Paenibacillus terrae]AET60287.1 hypothetical protein HPL003_17715 [Paenibacillus terrae HPL-003]
MQELIQDGLLKINDFDKGVVFMVDNRQYHINGVNGETLNINTGSQGNVFQSITNKTEADVTNLIEELLRYAEENGEPRDVEMVQAIETNIKEKKWESAKAIFGLLTKSIQVSASGISIAKAFGWL